MTTEEQNVGALTFLRELKTATSEAHVKLENVPLSVRLMADDVTNDEIMNYLRAMREVIYHEENVIFPLLTPFINDVDTRRKLSIIDADIAQMNNTNSVAKPFPDFQFMQQPTTGMAFGFMYVMEGSTLGGKIIGKHLRQKAPAKAQSLRFFDSYGERTGSLWKSFVSTLANHAIQDNRQQDIIEGARKTFTSIHDYFLSITENEH